MTKCTAALYRPGDFDAAEKNAKQALEPKHFLVFDGPGLTRIRRADQKGTRRAFDAAPEINPYLSITHGVAGRARKRLQDHCLVQQLSRYVAAGQVS